MKLYFSPGACSLSPHIALSEAGIPVTLVKTSTKDKTFDGGHDFRAVNPKGYIPALELDDGQVLTEGPAIVQWIADQAPASGLAPAAGTMARYRLQEMLNFVTTELHKQFAPLFDPGMPDEAKARFRAKIVSRLDYVDQQLADRDYILGSFTVADGYLFTVLRWTDFVGIDRSKWPHIVDYMARMNARPAVHAALVAEGLANATT